MQVLLSAPSCNSLTQRWLISDNEPVTMGRSRYWAPLPISLERAARSKAGESAYSPRAPADGLDELRKSGRWVEAIVPIGDGNKQCTLAGLYGKAGASHGGDDYIVNERLLAAAVARACVAADAPYMLRMDCNIQAKASAVLATTIQDAALVDF